MPETSFKIVPSTVWELSERVNDERRERLLKTPFDKIVEMIIRNGKVGKVHYERNKATISNHEKRSLKRYYVEIELPTKVVDLFHNGAGGYRAQYYVSAAIGEKANNFCCKKILGLIESKRDREKINHHSEAETKSFSRPTAKVWIHQGVWSRHKRISDRNLHVARWKSDPRVTCDRRKKLLLWSMLTPDAENRIKLIGGWLRCCDENSLGKSSKPNRSEEIHELGFT